jgi:GNAT superfamily N-acetyltransferase
MNTIAWQRPMSWFCGPFSELFWGERIDVWGLDVRAIAAAPVEGLGDGVRWDLADEIVLECLLRDPELQIPPSDHEFYRDLFRSGSAIHVGQLDGTIVYHGIAALRIKRSYSRHFLLRNDEFNLMRCYTRPSFRGRGIYPRAIRDICRHFAGLGYKTGYLGIATHNKASIRGAQKAGAVPTGSCYYRIRVPGRDLVVPRGPLRERYV